MTDEQDIFRLSSKSHWDVPVEALAAKRSTLLCSHPTPPTFDDGDADEDESLVDWNGNATTMKSASGPITSPRQRQLHLR